MALPNTFANETTPQMVELDENFNAVGTCTPIPCTVSGTNALTLTPFANTPDNSTLVTGMQFTGIAAATNTVGMTAAVAGNSPLIVYKDTPQGPKAMAVNELIIGCAFTLTYDLALTSGAGGFHLSTGGSVLAGQTITVKELIIQGSSTLEKLLLVQRTVTFTVIPANSTQDQNTTISGLLTTDQTILDTPSLASGLVATTFIPADGTCTIRYANVTAASIAAPGVQTERITILGFA